MKMNIFDCLVFLLVQDLDTKEHNRSLSELSILSGLALEALPRTSSISSKLENRYQQEFYNIYNVTQHTSNKSKVEPGFKYDSRYLYDHYPALKPAIDSGDFEKFKDYICDYKSNKVRLDLLIDDLEEYELQVTNDAEYATSFEED